MLPPYKQACREPALSEGVKTSRGALFSPCFIHHEDKKEELIFTTRKLHCLPVPALKYEESASSWETERPISTEGSHSSPMSSWVGEDGEEGGGGGWRGEGWSEENADMR